MCDTLWKKQSDYSIFLKNSDRSPNEPNLCIFFHSGEARGEVDCTYIKIPDPNKHYATLLIKPSWTWGAEMGINEFGVSIGNEAVFTKSKGKKTHSLIGMDFVRLALERCKDAKSATDEIVKLLKEYGQGGNCGFDHEFYYDNSYLISDYTESYILETAGKEYAIKQVKDQANISNRLTLHNDITDSSVQEDFANKFTEPIYTFFSGSADRIKRANESISRIKSYDLQKYFNTLRQHVVTQKRAIEKGSVKSVCMHAGGLFGDHTTGSMVSVIKDKSITVWITGSSSPCLSIFKPLYFERIGEFIAPPAFTNEQNSFKYWLKREKFNRAIYAKAIDINEWTKKATNLELEFINEDKQLTDSNATQEELHAFSLRCSKKEERLYDEYADVLSNFDLINLPTYWKKKTKRLGQNVFKRQLWERIK